MTQPPGDPWQPPLASAPLPPQPPLSPLSPLSSVDAWGRPLTDFDPAANRAVLERSTARLTTWLGVLLAVLALSGAASALGLYFGGRALLGLVSSAMTLLNPTLLNPGPLPAATGWLLGLAALLVLVLTGIYLGVVNWARELIGRLGRWAVLAPHQAIPQQAIQSPAADAVRIEQLRRTLAGWLTFGQWGTLLGALLSLGITLVVSFYADKWTRTLGGGGTIPLGPGFLAVQTVSSLVSSVPGVVVTWLILGAIRRFMNLAVQRARGMATGPLTQTAQTVNNWLLMCLILLGLAALYVVVVYLGLALALTLLPDMSTSLAGYGAMLGSGFLSELRAWWASLMVGLAVYSLLTVALYFALLLLSRSYALSLARTLDLPATPPAAPLPTGSAGENPNIFRGRF